MESKDCHTDRLGVKRFSQYHFQMPLVIADRVASNLTHYLSENLCFF